MKKKFIKCPVCKSKNAKLLFKSNLRNKDSSITVLRSDLKNTISGLKKHGRIVECKKCRLIYTNPREDLRLLMSGYESVEDIGYLQSKKYRKELNKFHLEKLRKFVKNGRLLDVGCFCGFFLEEASRKGFVSYGIEPSDWARKYAKSKNIKILGKTVKDIGNRTFDIVTLWDVIEHLPNPRKDIETLKHHLNENGYIIIGTPDISNFLVKIFGDNHPFFVRMHITLFNPQNLKYLLQECGFEVKKVYNYRRVYPIYYYLERLEHINGFFKQFSKLVKKFKSFSSIKIQILPKDEFVIIAKKK